MAGMFLYQLDILLYVANANFLLLLRSSPPPGETTQPPPGRIINIDWPASYVTNIVPSTEESLYMIIQPELDYRSQEHRVLVVRLSLRNEEFNELRIEAQVSPLLHSPTYAGNPWTTDKAHALGT